MLEALPARVKMIDLDLDGQLADLTGLEGYQTIHAVVRHHGRPIGVIDLPVIGRVCSAQMIAHTIVAELGPALLLHQLGDRLAIGAGPVISGNDLLATPHPPPQTDRPLVTVAVCSRDRPADLGRCLASLEQLDYPHLDLLVIDNCPHTGAAEREVHKNHSRIRYLIEPRPGLDWARNRAISAAQGEIIAFTDDDTVVDRGWVTALVAIFMADPTVMAVTGLVEPAELETPAQHLFERYGGFGRGFERRWYHCNTGDLRTVIASLAAGRYGTGANMAFRRDLFKQIGPFDPALDTGTLATGGGDLEIFVRLLLEGYTLVYEPAALVRHYHRRSLADLHHQLKTWGIGNFAYLQRTARAYPEHRLAIAAFGLWFIFGWLVRRLVGSTFHQAVPPNLILAEISGILASPNRYTRSLLQAQFRADSLDPSIPLPPLRSTPHPTRRPSRPPPHSTGRCQVDLANLPASLDTIAQHQTMMIAVTWQGKPIGTVTIAHGGQPISALRLQQAIIARFGLGLIDHDHPTSPANRQQELLTQLRQRLSPAQETAPPTLSDTVTVSIVVSATTRSEALQECLAALVQQRTRRQIEIIVTGPVTSQIVQASIAHQGARRLATEPGTGPIAALNTALRACHGQIIAVLDGAALPSPDWLEQLIAPFERVDVMVVTGRLESREARSPAPPDDQPDRPVAGEARPPIKEESFAVDLRWFHAARLHALPIDQLGSPTNYAVRATCLADPRIGLPSIAFDQPADMSSVATYYLFYRMLKAGYSLIHQPAALVWQRSPETPALLSQQQTRDRVVLHLTTLVRERDLRALVDLLYHQPANGLQGLLTRSSKPALVEAPGDSMNQGASGRRRVTATAPLAGLTGYLAGLLAFWRSYRQLRQPTECLSIATATTPIEMRLVERRYSQ